MLFSANVKRCASVGYIIPSHKTLNTGLLINCASKSGDSPFGFYFINASVGYCDPSGYEIGVV